MPSETKSRVAAFLVVLSAVALAALLGVLAFYFVHFHGPVGTDETLARFGDYVGGTLSAFFGLLSFGALAITVDLQLQGMRETRAAAKDAAIHATRLAKIEDHIRALDFATQQVAGILDLQARYIQFTGDDGVRRPARFAVAICRREVPLPDPSAPTKACSDERVDANNLELLGRMLSDLSFHAEALLVESPNDPRPEYLGFEYAEYAFTLDLARYVPRKNVKFLYQFMPPRTRQDFEREGHSVPC